MFSPAALHLINVSPHPDHTHVSLRSYVNSANVNWRCKHAHNEAEGLERVGVMEIEISVVTAGQWRNSDKQPTVRERMRGQFHSNKHSLSVCTLQQIGQR